MRYMLFLLVALLVSPLGAAASGPTVQMKNDAFLPARLTISAGQTVTFVNRDDDAHTVSAIDGAYDSKGMDTGSVWHHTFQKPGTYRYFCELHPFMTATIVVKAVK